MTEPRPPQRPIEALRIPGGCEDCGAYQTVDTSRAPLYFLTVHHDDTCPAYRAMEPQQ